MKKGKDLLNPYLDGLKNGFSSVCLRSLQVRQLTPPMERPTAPVISKIQQTSSTSSKNTNKITCKRTETLWAPKMAVAFANIYIAKIEIQILDKGTNKPHVWRLKLSLAHQQIRRQPVH